MGQPTVSKVETGRMVPSLDVLDRLLGALDLDEPRAREVRDLLAAADSGRPADNGPLSVRPLTKRLGPLGWCGRWEEHGLVFFSAVGKPLDAANVRRAFRQALRDVDGIDADEWTPRELRHSFVSLLSDRGVPLEVISRLVGHSGTAVTEEVYRKQIRPVIQTGAVVMDGIFGAEERRP
ncbi:hypothetical protein GCM10018782_45640 [Streptomyces griseoaurantiacus]|nr:hypothetical protein GCM10018782_45640 [Streptomyces griseoaurantiacus]